MNMGSRTFLVVSVAFGLLTAKADWNQTAAGTYDYNDAANWSDGTPNGVFPDTLTLTGAQTITFASDTTLADGLLVAYKGNFPMTFVSDGTGAKTLTLGGDVSVNVADNGTAAHVTFGAATDASNLVLDLGSEEREFIATASQNDPSKTGWLKLYAKLTNGAVAYSGKGAVKVYGANDYADGTTLANTGYLYMNSATAFGSGAVTIADCGGSAWPRLHCDAAVELANAWIVNGDFAFHGSAATVFTGKMTIDAPIRFWCESSNLTLRSPALVDASDNCAVGNFRKYGSKNLSTYFPIEVNGQTITAANGLWYQYGKISGSGGFKLVGDQGYNSAFFVRSTENDFSGEVTISSANGFCALCVDVKGALPDGVTFRMLDKGVLRADVVSGYSSSWYLANDRVAKDSTGVLAINNKETDDLDFSEYPNLSFGANGNNCYYTGRMTPANGCYRIAVCGSHVFFSGVNAFAGENDILIFGQNQNVYIESANDISGTVTVEGGNLYVQNASGALPNAHIVVKSGRVLAFASKSDSGLVRAKRVTLQNAVLQVSGNTSADVTQRISDSLIIDASIGGCSFIKATQNASKSVAFSAGKLEMPIPAVLAVEGAGLGDMPGANACNLLFDTAPMLVGGGGAAGTTTVSIVPRVIGGKAADGSLPGGFKQTFVTYDPIAGLRPLDLKTEYESSFPVSSPFANVRLVKGTTWQLSAPTTINSLLFQGDSSNNGNVSQVAAASGAENVKLTVTSGQIICGQRNAVNSEYATVPMDFGSACGTIYSAANALQKLSSPISGTGGLIAAQVQTTFSPGRYVQFFGTTGNLSGDVYVLIDSRFESGFLPDGSEGRTGDLGVMGGGRVFLTTATINALNGSGAIVNAYSGGLTLTVGTDGSDGDFGGTIVSPVSLVKVGEGRQRMAGVSSHTRTTSVQAGVLQNDGSFSTTAVAVAADATLAGSGSFAGLVTLSDGAKLEAGSVKTADQVMNLNGGLTLQGDAALDLVYHDPLTLGGVDVGGALTIPADAVVTVNVLTDAGDKLKHGVAHVVLESESPLKLANFRRGTGCGSLSLSEDGTQLLMTVRVGLAVFIR